MSQQEAPEPVSPTEAPWPPLWARKVAFFCGLGLIGYEVGLEHSKHVAVYGLGLMLTGLPIARGLDRLFDLLSGLKGK
jgi:hypothetical protein